MSPIEFEPTLWDGLLLLFKGLLGVVVGSLALAIATLPIFYLCLFTISKWTSARDGMDESNPNPLSRLVNGIFWCFFPLVSIIGTVFLLSHSGAIDYAANKIGIKIELKKKVGDRFEQITKKMSGKEDVLNRPLPEEGQVDDEKEKERTEAKQTVQMIRTMIVFFFYQVGPIPLLVIFASMLAGLRNVTLIVRSLTRNPLRTSLSYIAIFVLSTVLACVWSILGFLDAQTAEKEGNLKAIISERYQIPSQMRPTHLDTLKALLEELPPESKPKGGDLDIMTWAFVAGTLDPKNKTFQNSLFFFCMEPTKVLSMLDGLEDLTSEQRAQLEKAVDAMTANELGVVIGRDKLAQLGKRVGDRMQLTSLNYKDIVFDMVILGTFPEGTRYDQSAVMNRELLDLAIRSYGRTAGVAHPMADKCMNLIWIRLPDKKAFDDLAEKVNSSGKFNPAIKIETSSSGIGTFLDPFKEIFWGLRWILAPVLVGTMTLVISNAISISVRERRTEMAVLKVLGYQPRTIMFFVLGEAIFIGALSGFIATCLCTVMVNVLLGGLAMPIAFFGKFFIPEAALWWGPGVGVFTATIGSLMPAWSARSVKVTDVFSKVA